MSNLAGQMNAELEPVAGVVADLAAEIVPDPAVEVGAAAGDERDVYMAHRDFEERMKREGDAGGLRHGYHEPTVCEGDLLVVDRLGAIWVMQCETCRFEVGVNMPSADPERLRADLLDRARLPEFADRDFDRAVAENEGTLRAAQQYAVQFDRSPLPSFGLYGRPGRGKSHLIALVARTIILRHAVQVLYRSEADLFDELSGVSPEADARWRVALSTPVLVIDDLGAGRQTEWRRDRLQALVDHRYANELPLLIATNVPPAGWGRAFGERSASRLSGMLTAFELAGPDRRDPAQRALFTQES